MPGGGSLVPLAILAGVVAVVLVPLLRRGRIGSIGADFEVRYRPGGRGTTLRGRIPRAKLGAVRSFFERELRPGGPVTVRGRFGPPPARALRLEIRGPLDAGQRQRIRNALIELLR